MKKIAVIGSGISGNSAAWALSHQNDVTLFESAERPGGHSNTAVVEYGDRQIAVDTGFIVYNDHNYPLLTRLFEHLGVETEQSDMSFGVSLDSGRMEWSGQGLKSIFAQRRNLFSPGFLSMLQEIFKFNRICKDDLNSGKLCGSSFDEYLKARRFSTRLKEDYLVPMTAAIWSSPPQRMLEFPAESLIRFMDNHRLIHKKHERPKWRTVTGGSRQYVKRLLEDFRGQLRLNSKITAIEPGPREVLLTLADGSTETFDSVVVAAHSDQASAMLPDWAKDQKAILDMIPYEMNTVYLHCDEKLMPRRRAAWSAWNYLGSRCTNGSRSISVTYWMNRLQNIDPNYPLFVSLNPNHLPDPEKIFNVYTYEHPQFSEQAMNAQAQLGDIQGKDNLWFCGAWTRYGFHEDGLRSGLEVAQALGAPLPWDRDSAGLEGNPDGPDLMQAAE